MVSGASLLLHFCHITKRYIHNISVDKNTFISYKLWCVFSRWAEVGPTFTVNVIILSFQRCLDFTEKVVLETIFVLKSLPRGNHMYYSKSTVDTIRGEWWVNSWWVHCVDCSMPKGTRVTSNNKQINQA